MVLDRLALPIVQAPMAGGPSTPALAAAVTGAGGLGFVAAGYKTPAAMAADVEETRGRAGGPFGVNVFSPPRERADPAAVTAYVRRLEPEARRAGAALGEPVFDDDAYRPKLEWLLAHPVA